MKAKKLLAILLVVCLMLSCMSVTALAAEAEVITVGQIKTLSVEANEETWIDEFVYYTFTPEESGNYIFDAVCGADVKTDYTIWLSADAGEDCISYGEPLQFSAEAGKTYELTLNYFGSFTEATEYAVSVNKSVPLEGIELSVEQQTGCEGEYLYVDLIYQPALGEREGAEWTVSDPAVAELAEAYADYAVLYLVSAGTVTVTATTVSGKTASIEITVEEGPEVPAFVVGENKLTVPAYESLSFTFTPEVDGYYMVAAGNAPVSVGLYAESISDGTNDYYVLEAGVTYDGEVMNMLEEDTDCTVVIEYCEEVVIPEPVAMEITKLPDNTTYLRENLQYLWNGNLMEGLELKITWDNGSVTDWSYDEEFGCIGNYYLSAELVETDSADQYELVMTIDELEIEPVSCVIKVVDLTVQSLELVDDTPLQIVEYSCGIDLSMLGLDASGWYYFPFAAYTREVKITFSDGSTVITTPGNKVYGMDVFCQDNQGGVVVMQEGQPEGFWSKDNENLVAYYYGEMSVMLTVEIVDSPVESIEVVTPPENDAFMIDDEAKLIMADSTVMDSLRDLYEGMSLKVNYKDGTSKTFAPEDLQWVEVQGVEVPFLDGYPIGFFGGWLLLMEEPVPPCVVDGYVEYMGVSATYPIDIVEEFPAEDDTGDTEDVEDPDKPVIEPIPETGDADLIMGVVMLTCLMGMAVVVTGKKKYF